MPIPPKNFVSALQNIKRKRNYKRELAKPQGQGSFYLEAPPSHYENRKLQLYDTVQLDDKTQQSIEHPQRTEIVQDTVDSLGFDADKNIDLKKEN